MVKTRRATRTHARMDVYIPNETSVARERTSCRLPRPRDVRIRNMEGDTSASIGPYAGCSWRARAMSWGVRLGQTPHRHHVQNRQHLVPGTGQRRLLPPKYILLDGFTEENAKYIYMDWIIDLCVIFLVHPGELYLVFQLTPCKKLSNSDETRS
jgi:hypothetical protein